jgi:hypothetical protein
VRAVRVNSPERRAAVAYLVEFVGDDGLFLVVSPRTDEATGG